MVATLSDKFESESKGEGVHHMFFDYLGFFFFFFFLTF